MDKTEYKPMILSTYTGREFDVLKMTTDDVVADDIAMSLSRQRRYIGHTVIPWSVAQHSILCSMIADKLKADKNNIKACFIHDFEEAYVQDVIYSIKRSKCMTASYDEVSHHVSKVIYDHFDCHGFNRKFVDTVDQLAYCFEHVAFKSNVGHDPNVNEETWEKFVWLLNDVKMGIPIELIEMSEEEQAKILYEFMLVQQAEKAFGQEISSDIDDVVDEIHEIYGKEKPAK